MALYNIFSEGAFVPPFPIAFKHSQKQAIAKGGEKKEGMTDLSLWNVIINILNIFTQFHYMYIIMTSLTSNLTGLNNLLLCTGFLVY